MPEKPTVIKFFAPVLEVTINSLMSAIDQKMKEGETQFTILISSPGGSYPLGLSAYNYLKGLPVTITTHNFGTVDSIGVVLFCGGSNRLSVPQASFLLHGINTGNMNGRFGEKQLEDRLKTLSIDNEIVAKVIAANTSKSVKDVTNAMLESTTLSPDEAKAWGLIHDIKSELFESGSEVISIQYQEKMESAK